MATMQLPTDFKEFLQLLNSEKVEYLLVGGYAVSFHGYPRATGDMDIWIAVSAENAKKIVNVYNQFGFSATGLSPEMFLKESQVIRIGVPPLRIEVLTSVTGLRFTDCYARRQSALIDGVLVDVIALADLKINKKAAGRHKDLSDLENLP